MEKKRHEINYNGLDLGKFIMAICVVAIHTAPLINCQNKMLKDIYSNLVNLAVPYFFVSTAWLISVKWDDIYSEACLRYLQKRIVYFMKVYLIWELIYFPCILYAYCNNGHGLYFNAADYFRKLVLVGSNYYSYQFWFLVALIYMLIMLYILLKWKVSLSIILIFSVVCDIIGTLINYWINTGTATGLLRLIVRYFSSLFGESSILINYIYICLGIIMANYHIKLSKSKIVALGLVGCVGGILLPKPICEFVRPFEVTAVFQLFLQLNLKNHSLFFILREASMVFYYTHLYFLFLYGLLFNRPSLYGYASFIFCLISCIGISIIYITLKRHLCLGTFHL